MAVKILLNDINKRVARTGTGLFPRLLAND